MSKRCAALIGIVGCAHWCAHGRRPPRRISTRARRSISWPGFSPGGGYDINARVLARHMGRHIPGNPDDRGAEHARRGQPQRRALSRQHRGEGRHRPQHLQFRRHRRGAAVSPDKIKIDFRKYNWIGSISQDLTVCYVWHALGVKTLDELKARPKVHYGSTGAGSSSDLNQRILKNIFGVKLQQVGGYPGSAEQRIAIERGELDGDCGAWSSIPVEWIKEKKINPVIRSSPATAPDMPPNVPFSIDIAPNERARQIMQLLLASNQLGRPFMASAAVPADRVRILREAFAATMKDPAFIAEAQKLRLPLSPTVGEAAGKVVDDIYAIPPDIVEAAKAVMRD